MPGDYQNQSVYICMQIGEACSQGDVGESTGRERIKALFGKTAENALGNRGWISSPFYAYSVLCDYADLQRL